MRPECSSSSTKEYGPYRSPWIRLFEVSRGISKVDGQDSEVTAKIFSGRMQNAANERAVGRSTREIGAIGKMQIMHEIKSTKYECLLSFLSICFISRMIQR
jgi:hypothetical protein